MYPKIKWFHILKLLFLCAPSLIGIDNYYEKGKNYMYKWFLKMTILSQEMCNLTKEEE